VRVPDGDDVVAITATEAARTNASERRMKVFTTNSGPTRNRQPTVATLQIVCFVSISSDGENGFVALLFRNACPIVGNSEHIMNAVKSRVSAFVNELTLVSGEARYKCTVRCGRVTHTGSILTAPAFRRGFSFQATAAGDARRPHLAEIVPDGL
jgi:hypothetical protein